MCICTWLSSEQKYNHVKCNILLNAHCYVLGVALYLSVTYEGSIRYKVPFIKNE